MPGVKYQLGPALRSRAGLYCFDGLSKSAIRSWATAARSKHAIIPQGAAIQWLHHRAFGRIDTPELGGSYVAEFFWNHTPVPSHEPFRAPKLQRPPDEWNIEGMRDGSYVLVSPTSGWAKKMWNVDKWVEVMKTLRDRLGIGFVLTGGSEDWQKEHCAMLAAKAGEMMRNYSNKTSLKEFLWLVSHAQLVLSVDGATSHLAQAFGVPSLTLFGPTNKDNWHRETPSHIAVQAPVSHDGKRLMRNLGVPSVLEALKRLLPLAG
jgi:ADP-heptose:LPS heptosyltransferase